MTEHFEPFSDGELRRALQRREPPEGFAERTLARIHPAAAKRPMRSRPTRWTGWAALAAAASLALVVGGVQYRAHQHETQARKAAEELTLAMRITSDALRDVQNKLVNRK